MYACIEFINTSRFIIPNDSENKLAISIHYYEPYTFVLYNDNDYDYYDYNWGSETNYKQLFSFFENIRNNFTKNDIPIIIGEVEFTTEQKIDISSIREYLYIVFSLSVDYDGVMACLWDTSNKNFRKNKLL